MGKSREATCSVSVLFASILILTCFPPAYTYLISVTMLPIQEADTEEDSSHMTPISEADESESITIGMRRDQSPLGGDIEEAIEKGDWAAVGATAAILASSDLDSDNSSAVDNATRDGSSVKSIGSSAQMSVDSADMRAAEIDQLVEEGNWDVSIILSVYILFQSPLRV